MKISNKTRKSASIASVLFTCFLLLSCADDQSFTDSRDGEVYKTVKIGNKVWMAENLRFKAKGSFLNPSNPNKAYGRLYNWNAVMGHREWDGDDIYIRGICPKGWHVPHDKEWDFLQKQVERKASVLKSTIGWEDAEGNPANGDNSSGFNAFPAGGYDSDGYSNLGYAAYFWSSTALGDGDVSAWARYIDKDSIGLERDEFFTTIHFSCRCVQD